MAAARPFAVDVASGVEAEPGVKDHALMAAFLERAQTASRPAGDRVSAGCAFQERFGVYGGRYVPEVLIPALDELSAAWAAARDDPEFRAELDAPASRLRGPADAALPRRPPLGAGRPPRST